MFFRRWRDVFVCFLLAAAPFFLYFFRYGFRGYDGYATFSHVGGLWKMKTLPMGAEFAFSVMPCSFFWSKVVLFLLFFLSLYGIASMGNLFHPKKGYLAALFSFLSPALLFNASKFENDSFAVPFLVWACFFFTRARISKNKWDDVVCLTLVCVAGLFWYGAIYFLLVFAVTSAVIFLAGAAAWVLLSDDIIGNLVPNFSVVEQLPGTGLFLVFGSVFFISQIPAAIMAPALGFFALGVIKMKFAWFMAPYLAIGVLCFYENTKFDKNRFFRGVKNNLVSTCVVLVVVWGIVLVVHPPYQHQWDAVDYAIAESPNGFVWCDWSYGYWVLFRGGTPSQYGGGQQGAFGSGVVLSFFPQSDSCELLQDFGTLKVYRCQ